MARKLSNEEKEEIVADWRRRVRELLNQIQEWSVSAGWQTHRTETEVREEGLPEYAVDALEVDVDADSRVHLKPIARFTLNGRGAVDLYGWPSLRRVRLQPSKDASQWIVMTDSGIPLRQEWNQPNFVMLVSDLVAA